MYELTILKDITYEALEPIFMHDDDITMILEAVEDDTLEYIPHTFIVMLANEGFIE